MLVDEIPPNDCQVQGNIRKIAPLPENMDKGEVLGKSKLIKLIVSTRLDKENELFTTDWRDIEELFVIQKLKSNKNSFEIWR